MSEDDTGGERGRDGWRRRRRRERSRSSDDNDEEDDDVRLEQGTAFDPGSRLSQTSVEGPAATTQHLVTAIVHRQRSTASEVSEAPDAATAT
ncbi:Protein of unknown function, partial [Gryllus bimaculatus]